MRVLHVNKFLYRRGGAESYMEDSAALFAQAGHDVEFWGMRHPENTHLTYERYFAEEMSLAPAPSGVRAKAGTAARMVWSPRSRALIGETLDAFRPDVVHLHNVYHQLSPSILGPIRSRSIATVMTLHDYKLVCPSYQLLDHGAVCEACLGGQFRHAVRRRCKDDSLALSTLLAVETRIHRTTRAYDGVGLFLCPSRFLHDKVASAGIYTSRLRHLPNFVADDAGAAGDVDGPVVAACRLSPEKGLDVLVRAAAHFPAGRRLVVAGDGPSRSELETLAREVAPGLVTFTGRLEKAEIMRLMRSAAVIACPSRWQENQPMVLIEAMAAGVPMVGTDIGGISELVRPGVDGALAPVDDPAALAAAVGTVVADADGWRRMSRAARARYEDDFSAGVHRTRLAAAYQEARDLVRGSAR